MFWPCTIIFNFNNKFCPRDTKDQIKYFKKKIKLKNIRKNDLIFWKGHVAIALSREAQTLIHAYGPLKKTIDMPIKKTIDKIYKTANLRVIGIRRITLITDSYTKVLLMLQLSTSY